MNPPTAFWAHISTFRFQFHGPACLTWYRIGKPQSVETLPYFNFHLSCPQNAAAFLPYIQLLENKEKLGFSLEAVVKFIARFICGNLTQTAVTLRLAPYYSSNNQTRSRHYDFMPSAISASPVRARLALQTSHLNRWCGNPPGLPNLNWNLRRVPQYPKRKI